MNGGSRPLKRKVLKMDNKLLISSKELSEMLSVSEKWVIRHRHRIVGAQKVGSRLWRFNRQIIEKRIAQGRDIVG